MWQFYFNGVKPIMYQSKPLVTPGQIITSGVMLVILITCITIYINGLMPEYSSGSRSGVITKISHKGAMVKSYEAEMLIGSVLNGATAGLVPEKFYFSVDNKEVAAKIEALSLKGSRVQVTYNQYFTKPMRFDTPYVVTAITE